MNARFSVAALFALSLLPSTGSACEPAFYADELLHLGETLLEQYGPGTAASLSDMTLIRNCTLNTGETDLQVKNGKDRLIHKVRGQKDRFYTATYRSNFSCEFDMASLGDESSKFVRLPLVGEVVFASSVMNAAGTSCEGSEYSFILSLSVKGFKNGLLSPQEILSFVGEEE